MKQKQKNVGNFTVKVLLDDVVSECFNFSYFPQNCKVNKKPCKFFQASSKDKKNTPVFIYFHAVLKVHIN